MTKYLTSIAILVIVMLGGCGKSADDCGKDQVKSIVIYSHDFFNQPSADIHWGITSGVRSYTYNWTFANICTKQNPKVEFLADLTQSNGGLSNPFSFSAGTYTCIGVQAHHASLTTTSQTLYESEESEIGMNQCFSGAASATIYPYIVVSFNTLGSSTLDSNYLIDHFNIVKATVTYKDPK
jgi:hypothetical protein